ncbi:pyrophosphatase PpaX [Halalkalibacillus sediminis]|uniref:Pyrophosphatase PpaX n=1 Tax=Halalkalibacillus sediminis TaxID=2018042 RepID=A0A2I0QUI7_9BACI|nr:pyrophosphatase PpaX [Halalkalibacillus sediminis]PKR78013.1 pyrophosphatase PpaX [Halalkalibacillus sediminis]
MTIKTLLFDLDGTLIDTNELIAQSYEYTIEKHTDKQYTREEVLQFIGPPLQDAMQEIDPTQVDEMMATYREHNLAHHDSFVKMYEGVYETIRSLHEKGVPMAIVTTKLRRTALKGLEVTGLDQFFDVVIGLDDVSNAKPDPEPVLKGMNAIDGSPETTIMIGDNSHDIHAGKNAGTQTAGVAWSAKGKDFMESLEPDFLLNHISDLVELVGE